MRLGVGGFKSIKDLQPLDLRPVNVLIGANGSGKSNLISFLRLLNAIAGHHLQDFVMPETDLTLKGFTDCPAGGLEFHDFIHGSQKPDFSITYPEGVGRFLIRPRHHEHHD